VTGSSLAHYALLHLRSGRRSNGVKKNDVLHPAARVSGNVRLRSLDEPVGEGEDGHELTLHDCLAANTEDPASAAARHLDWTSVIQSLDRTAQAILMALVEGRELTLLVRPLQRCRTSLHYDKVKLGRLIQERLGEDILVQAQSRPEWTHTVEAVRERLACRAERRAG
jgi:hypothetical protein